MLGGQQVLPERGKTAVASGAHLGELAFQVFAHGTDDFSLGHSGRRCSPGQTETRQAPVPMRQSWLTGMSASGSHWQSRGSIPPDPSGRLADRKGHASIFWRRGVIVWNG